MPFIQESKKGTSFMIKIGLIILNLLNTLQPFCLNGDEPVVQNGRDTSGDIIIVIGLIALIIIPES